MTPTRLGIHRALPVPILVIVLTASAVIFRVFPQIDWHLAVRLFDLSDGFQVPLWLAISRETINITLVVLWLVLIVQAWRPWLGLDRHTCLILAVAGFISSLLLANLLFKGFNGRPRPLATLTASSEFQPAYLPSDLCNWNCSFFSGEASTIGWALGLLWLLPARVRLWGLPVWLTGLAVIWSHRLLSGGHFLSDLWTGTLVSLLILSITDWLFAKDLDKTGSM